MKKCLLILFVLGFAIGCGPDQVELQQLRKERDELNARLEATREVIKSLRDSVAMLSIPANQRLAKINSLVAESDFQAARYEIEKLNSLFPESKEAKSTPAIVDKINRLVEQKRAEEERIKALGFKALKASTVIKVDYNKVEISNISIGNTFTFDSYGDTYHYRSVDRGNKYISAAMKITSTEKDPDLPQVALYSITGDIMNYVGSFDTRFTRWRDYGAYLGNYGDDRNDFAKVSSVNFKIGYEAAEEIIKKPYALVMKKENALSRQYDRWSNPPYSYLGSVDYPKFLKLDDFTGEGCQYAVIRIANL